jgi:penicillin-binding protein 2
MKSMCPRSRLMKLSIALLLAVFVLAAGVDAQSRKKSSTAKKTTTKKNEKQATDARKDSGSKATAKKDTKKGKTASDKSSAKRTDKKADAKRDKLTAKEKRAQERESKKKKLDPKKAAELRRAEAERRREAEERRQAVLAEKRRREAAARAARERKLAFERGLRTETIENIANDNTDGEDLQVRRAAVNALGKHAGTVVVMEAQTGKLLTVVNQEWAIKHGFKPCSTIKLVTGVAGLNENVINEEGRIGSSSSGMNLDYALAKSNNPYFQRVGSQFGNAKMIEYAKKLGLGEPTGINAEGETAGKLPYGNNNARIYSHGDDFEVTPLQLAVMVSALTNGGKKVVPQTPRPRLERTGFRERTSGRVDLPRDSVEGVLPGMVGAAEYGTARRGVDASMGVGGKTGSCIGKGSWVGLFASVAPVEDPKYSVVVITRGQSERGKYAAAIAGRVYEALRPRIERKADSLWANRNRKPVIPADTQTAAGEDEEDDAEEAAMAGDQEPNEAPIIVRRAVQAPVQPAVKKLVQKTSQSKPTNFKPVIIEYDRTGAETSRPTSELSRPRIVRNK